MNRLSVLNTLEQEIGDYIQSSMDNCNSDISEIRQGDHYPDEVAARPFVGILLIDDRIEKETFATIGVGQRRVLSIRLYSYLNSDGLGNYDVMFQLIEDLEYFFKYNFTHKSDTVVEDITPYQNGTMIPTAVFDMYIKISYELNL